VPCFLQVSLLRKRVFCTEPFRIPFAGKVDVCCFDKTGTLTSDDMEFKGIVSLAAGGEPRMHEAASPGELPPQGALVLGTCRSIADIEGQLVGDPLECAANETLRFKVTTPQRPGGAS